MPDANEPPLTIANDTPNDATAKPPHNLKAWEFTSGERARELGRKGAYARLDTLAKRRARHRELRDKAVNEALRIIGPSNAPPQANSLHILVLDEIARVREALESKIDPETRVKVGGYLVKLLERERIFRGEPMPGSLRPTGKAKGSGGLMSPPAG